MYVQDCTIRIWDTVLCQCVRVLSSHTASVTCIRWGGSDLIYSASQDRTVKVWRASDVGYYYYCVADKLEILIIANAHACGYVQGVMCRSLEGHGHWVNSLALNTDYVIRTGAFDPAKATLVHKDVTETASVRAEMAQERYNAVLVSNLRYWLTYCCMHILSLWCIRDKCI